MATSGEYIDSQFVIDPSGIGEFVKHGSCPMYPKLRYEGDEKQKERGWKEAFKPLSPLLSEEGRRFENEIYDIIEPESTKVIDTWRDYNQQEENDEKILQVLKHAAEKQTDTPTVLEQAHFADNIGAFFVAGDADIIFVWPTQKKGHVEVRIIDIKASWEEKTYHRIQTSTYSILLKKLLKKNPTNFTYNIGTGIITRESELDSIQPGDIPYFNNKASEGDVYNLLQERGVLHETFKTDFGEIEHQFDNHCQSCPFNEVCMAESVEDRDIRLLGLTRGEQKILRKYGFKTINDVSRIIEPLDKPKPYNYEYPEIKQDYKDVVQRLAEEHGVGERLPIMAQKAQALLGRIDEHDPHSHDAPWTQMIVGSGDGSLPDDDPHPNMEPSTEERNALIRVYLNVQQDYLRDKVVSLSARIDCGKRTEEPLSFSKVTGSIPDNTEEQEKVEKELLRDFSSELFDKIQLTARLTGQSGKAPLHFYFYTSQERNNLMEAVKRHPDIEEAKAIQDLLGMRAGIDQSMVSILQKEIRQRVAIKSVSDGLLPVMEQISPFNEEHRMDYSDWEYERENGTSVQLQDAFYRNLFNYKEPYIKKDGGITFLLGEKKDADGFYPLRGRFGAQIPLEYIWAAKGIDKLTPEWTDNPQYKGVIRSFRWVSNAQREQRITREDVEALGKKLCKALEHVERGISYKNSNIEKKAIPLDTLAEFSIGESDLASAFTDYLDLEYATSKQDTLKHYQKPMKQRILSGKSIPVEITSAEIKDGLLHAEGKLLYKEFGFASPEYVANSCRQKSSGGSTSGSRMVATPIYKTENGFKSEAKYPNQILHSPAVSIEEMDTDSMRISLLGFPDGGKSDDEYREWHKWFTTDPKDEDDVLFQSGEKFILDPNNDDMTAQRSKEALENADSNPLYDEINSMINSHDPGEVEKFDPKKIDEFVHWVRANHEFGPNSKQEQFINSIGSRISLLQGPPGTGKTSGAIAVAVLARLYASRDPINGLITGASNKSIDEVLEDISQYHKLFQNEKGSELFDSVRLIRLTDQAPENPLPNVEYVNYHHDKDIMKDLWQKLYSPLSRQSTLGEASGQASQQILIFATPSRTYGFANSISREEGIDLEELFGQKGQLFDLLAADEASMLPLPQLLIGGAFLDNEDWQALIAGDQRQMPPVQKHDWSSEDRRIIEEIAPHLSTLDYFRFLRGETVDEIEDIEDLDSPEVDIPITRLQETYRCHTEVANFLRKWVYHQDDINYTSSLTYTISEPKESTVGIETALDPESPITLLLHNDSSSRQSNSVEASITRDIVEAAPEDASIGIVTPHNSQKGLLESICERGQIDTVERFQGGERDIMVLNATVSDPDYLDDESEFILDPNRLNVALSRMKKKLIVIAPRSIFQLIPNDIDEYENAMVWKGLHAEVHPERGSEWAGSLEEILNGVPVGDAEADVEVFQKESN